MPEQMEELIWLKAYAYQRSQDAFALIVRQYIDVVYASAKRQVRDDALAEDVTQAVFIVMAQKAASIPTDRPLSAWLLKTTSYCAANARRARKNRETHERRAAHMARMNRNDGEDESAWEELSPLLDEGLNKLRAADRDALLLKFFEKKSLRQIGDALGISEEAAGKRVARAVDKLRDFFRRRGAVVSAAALGTMLMSQSAQAAPAALLGSVTATSATTAASTAAATMAKGAMAAMAVKQTTAAIAVGAALLLGVGGGAVIVNSMTNSPSRRTISVTEKPNPAVVEVNLAPASRFTPHVTFSDGTAVAVRAITEVPPSSAPASVKARQVWWAMDGTPVPPVRIDGLPEGVVGDEPNHRKVRLIFASNGPGALDGNLVFQLGIGGSSSMCSIHRNNERVTDYVISLPMKTEQTKLRMGLARGPWREDASTSPTGKSSKPFFGKIEDINGKCVAQFHPEHLPDAGDHRDMDVVAMLKGGGEERPAQWTGTSTHTEVLFRVPVAKIERIVWRTRPFDWVTIPSVALRPKSSTTQEVVQ